MGELTDKFMRSAFDRVVPEIIGFSNIARYLMFCGIMLKSKDYVENGGLPSWSSLKQTAKIIGNINLLKAMVMVNIAIDDNVDNMDCEEILSSGDVS